MKTHIVCPMEYGFDAAEALAPRLPRTVRLERADGGAATVLTRSGDEELALSVALSDILLREGIAFELAKEIDRLPFSGEDNRRILPDAARLALGAAGSERARARLAAAINDHFQLSDTLILPGYMRFRMRETLAVCQLAAARAADSTLLEGEYSHLIASLAEFARAQSARMGEVTVVLNADGSCTLSALNGERLNCGDKSGLVSVLLGLAPSSIMIYDLSCGKSCQLYELISRVFGERAKLFR